MDFFRICEKELRNGKFEVYPDFTVKRSNDLMIRGRSFYAIWDEEAGLWSTDEYDVPRLVDAEMQKYISGRDGNYQAKDLLSYTSTSWTKFRAFMNNISDNSTQLDQNLTFANTPVKKNDYVSRRLPYSLADGSYESWDELVGTLYSIEERAKIEWAIGAVISGDSKKLQKFMVFYGPAGSGKSTILNIIQKLFEGYTTTFDAKALSGNNNAFSTEVFKSNPLVAIQHDGDLSRIEDNTKLNSIISHEDMTINEKYKASYTAHINSFLFMGTNLPVKISDAKSGIIRRLIDVHPTGVTIPINHYNVLMDRVDFELGAIAKHCLDVYREMGKNYYNKYRPMDMMYQTDIFFNFIEAHYDIFKAQNGATLKQAYTLYKEYCADTGIPNSQIIPQYKLRDELKSYFDEYKDRYTLDGVTVRGYYLGFNAAKFKQQGKDETTFSLVMDEKESLLDKLLEDQLAQYATEDGVPGKPWAAVKTKLSELDTSQEHYVKMPLNHIVIDFDLKDINGTKSLERNLQAASSWPASYAELSKSGNAVHLHYLWEGNIDALAREYSAGIEIKVFNGNSSLRRRFTKGNSVPIATINSGLPLKGKKVLQSNTIKSEKSLRDLITRNLKKEIHPGTKPSIDFIHKILEDAYDSGMTYDVTDMRPKIIAFASNSTNQSLASLKIVQKMKFASELAQEDIQGEVKDERLVFFDVEVYPNLFVVCWKYQGSDEVVRMINPSPEAVEGLFDYRLVGFNNRRYDNHILYARHMGYSNEELFNLSQKLIVQNNHNAAFGVAYNLSYTDVWDFSSEKQGLKKFEIDLGIHHSELDLEWDSPVAEERWPQVVEYCVNDVVATEAVFEARRQDFVARQILATLSGLSVNDTTHRHAAKIIFGDDPKPQKQFQYTDLKKEFPGYEFEGGKSSYKGEDPGEGGYVYAEPGMYEHVALLDIVSMHPTSIEQLNLFGEYTGNFSALKDARVAIKRKEYSKAREMFDGALAPFLDDEDQAKSLSYALKIAINIVYGLTSAKFANSFKDIRNVDNIVAKRGALFMIDLKHAVQEMGFTVAHIKTDSIKIPDATPDVIEFVKIFGEKYGYEFEHEATYDKFCLVNDAVYIARESDHWTAVGAQFQHPYVFKSLFTHDPIVFDDYCETKSVKQGSMYLDFDSVNRPAVMNEGMHFVGRTGRFVPVLDIGGILYRVKDDKRFAVTGTKGHLWMEAEMVKTLKLELDIDLAYFENLVRAAFETIDYYGDFKSFVEWE